FDGTSDAPPDSPQYSPKVVKYKTEWKGFTDREITGNRFGGTVSDSGHVGDRLDHARSEARKNNNAWLSPSTSSSFWSSKNAHLKGVLAGTTKEGNMPDQPTMDRAAPALKVLGDVVTLLGVEGGAWRFKYHGLIKNKRGMEFFAEKLLRDEGVNVTGVRFETGGRVRDMGE
ncbi:hypothetical protein TrRE_jg619, partial [Triparma retinervis]